MADPTYDGETGVWVDEDGQQFIRNIFGSQARFITVEGDVWRGNVGGKGFRLAWHRYPLRSDVVALCKRFFAERLSHYTISYIGTARPAVKALSRQIGDAKGLLDTSLGDWDALRQTVGAGVFGTLRQLHSYAVAHSAFHSDALQTSMVIGDWPTAGGGPPATLTLRSRHVGTYQPEELALIQDFAYDVPDKLSDADLVARVVLILLIETGRRPLQLTGTAQNALSYRGDLGGHVLTVPGVKAQTGSEGFGWPVSDVTAELVTEMDRRPRISDLQASSNRLLVVDTPLFRRTGQLDSAFYIRRTDPLAAHLVSPSTRERLYIRALRLRHTYASIMARRGDTAEDISAALEHGDPRSALIYIDAFGSSFDDALNGLDPDHQASFAEIGRSFCQGGSRD